MHFVNLTPHRIVIRTPAREFIVEPSGEVARVQTRIIDAGRNYVDGVGVTCEMKEYMRVEGLPNEGVQPGAWYLVSSMVLAALKERGIRRSDVAAPATGPGDHAVRDAAGNIVAVTRLNVLC